MTTEPIEAEVIESPITPFNPDTRYELGRFTPSDDHPLSFRAGAVTITVTPREVADWLCKGMPMSEANRLLVLCANAGLNPFSGEVVVNKFKNDRGGFDYQYIVRQQAWRRLACEHPQFKGMTYEDSPNDPSKYELPILGVCTIWRKDAPEPYRQTVYYEEAITEVGAGGKPRKKTSGFPVCQPREWLRGVCEARGLRHVFPDRFSGFYDEGEKVG